MAQQIGPFRTFRFSVAALAHLGRVDSKDPAKARCLTRACATIRDDGAEAHPSFRRPNLFDVYRCSSIIEITLLQDGQEAVILNFYSFVADLP